MPKQRLHQVHKQTPNYKLQIKNYTLNIMEAHIYSTPMGDIHYWCTPFEAGKRTLVMLPGLTASSRLFEKQIEAFIGEYNLWVWDAPAHAKSRPFALRFTLAQQAQWLHDILSRYITDGSLPVLVGQSMGGYVAQEYLVQYPGQAAGFVSIGSAPLEREYVTSVELWLLRQAKPFYKLFPWKTLQKMGAIGCAETDYGRRLMQEMMQDYTHTEYCNLAGYGYTILADAIAQHTAPIPLCPTLLLVGNHDHAGSAKRYDREWSHRRNLPLHIVPHSGHNANTDNPTFVNA